MAALHLVPEYASVSKLTSLSVCAKVSLVIVCGRVAIVGGCSNVLMTMV